MSDGRFSSENVSNSPQKGKSGDMNGSSGMLRGANGVSSSVTNRQASFNFKDSHVKFCIKFFKVPELYIEVLETATVGSLKAVTAIFKGELHVGVLLQGKNIRDENKTLMLSGISCKDNLDTLGFTLEPSALQASPSMCADDPHPSLSCDIPQLITG